MILKYCIFVVLLFFILSQTDVSSQELVVCKIPENIQVKISDRHKVDIYNNELLIKYKNLSVYLYPDTTMINIVLNGSLVEFQAYMIDTNVADNLTSKTEKISWSSNGLILGFGQLREINKGYYQVQQYHFFLPTNSNGSSNLLEAAEHEIRRLVRVCLEIEIGKNIKLVTKRDLNNLKNVNDFRSITVLPQSNYIVTSKVSSSTPSPTETLKINVNDLIDLAVGTTINIMKIYDLEKIKLPNINETFTSTLGVVGIKGQIQTFNGTFEGLATLKRTAEVILIRENHKYTASCGFGISNAIIRIEYKLKYGFLNICGNILATAENIALKAKISVDYNEPQCITELEEIKVSEFAKLKVKFTGLGIMNNIGSKLINWFTKYFINYFKGMIERDLKNFLKKQLLAFDCEKYRIKII